MKNKNILFVFPRMNSGGAERVASLLANHLVKNNKVTLLSLVDSPCFYPLDKKVNYITCNISIKRDGFSKGFLQELYFFPRALLFVRRTIKQGSFDRVISFLPPMAVLLALCKMTGVKFNHVVSERNDPFLRPWLWRRLLLPTIYKKAVRLVCQSTKVASYYNGVSADKKSVIANPIELSALPIPVSTPIQRIVSVGRLFPQKNFALLIDSFAQIANRFSAYRLDIYGEGVLHSQLQQQINRLGLQDRITLKGRHPQVLTQIADAALFVLPSNYEGFPNALLEALALGLPLISTDFTTGTARELIGPENGLVVPVGDKQAMANAMATILANPGKQQAMRRANIEKAKKYDLPIIMRQWEESLERAGEEHA